MDLSKKNWMRYLDGDKHTENWIDRVNYLSIKCNVTRWKKIMASQENL